MGLAYVDLPAGGDPVLFFFLPELYQTDGQNLEGNRDDVVIPVQDLSA